VLLVFRTYIEKFLVVLMLIDHIEKAFISAIGTIKNFSLAIEDEFLQVECNRLSDADILGILRNTHFHFFAGAKEVIDGVAAREDDSRKVRNIQFLFPKLPGRDTLQPDEWLKLQFYTVLPFQFKVRRLITFRSWLGNQDFFDR